MFVDVFFWLNETHAVVVFSNGISKRCPSMGQVYCTHDYTCFFIQRWYMVYVVWKGIWIIYLQNIYFYSYGTWSFSKTDFVGDAPAFGPFKTTGCILLSSSMTEVLAAEENSNSCKGMTLSTLKRAQKKLAPGGFFVCWKLIGISYNGTACVLGKECIYFHIFSQY